MQIINKVHKCSACGCIAFPDATRCPKCDMPFNHNNYNDIPRQDEFICFAIIDSRYLSAMMCK